MIDKTKINNKKLTDCFCLIEGAWSRKSENPFYFTTGSYLSGERLF